MKLVYLFDFFIKKFVTLHGHTKVKKKMFFTDVGDDLQIIWKEESDQDYVAAFS
jgi:hypothetical protein